MKNFKWIEKFRPLKLQVEVDKFKEVTIEATFIVRATFFILFGFLMNPDEIFNLNSLPLAGAIVFIILLIRWVTLKIAGLPTSPLLYVAPRGLITILLFLAIVPEQAIPMVNKSLVIQTVLLSVVAMMIGLMTTRKEEPKPEEENKEAAL